MRLDVSRFCEFFGARLMFSNWLPSVKDGCMKRTRKQARSIPAAAHRGLRARSGGQTLRTYTIGALPIVNQVLERMQLERFLRRHLPRDGKRMAIPTARCLMLLVRNILFSREPIYGLGEWAERFAPEQLGLGQADLAHLNDDRVGRGLDRLFQAEVPSLVLDVVRHVIGEFGISLEELHNDSTTVSFYGAYDDASEEEARGKNTRLAITFGHSKDHRPDLKQLLYILTVTDDGGVPLYYTAASGNVTDDTTHRETWNLLCNLIGRPDFLYVADCKLATRDNLQYIHNQGGCFVTILPRTRREDSDFRQLLLGGFDNVPWEHVLDTLDDDGELRDRISTYCPGASTSEGFRLLWYHSTQKAKRDAQRRSRSIDQATQELVDLQNRLRSPKTRLRERAKVEAAVKEILERREVSRWIDVQVDQEEYETFKQATRGRPGKETRYVRKVKTRCRLTWSVNKTWVEQDQATDGVFPLVTNQWEMTAEAVLRAYKRQPLIEKRFSQFKSDFEVAPVYLKEASRIQALLTVYFFVLMVQTLLEREVRLALARSEYDSLPLYPENRACHAPTTRRILDVFEMVQRHELSGAEQDQLFVTQLTPLQSQIAKWFGFRPNAFGK
jgi:transposase